MTDEDMRAIVQTPEFRRALWDAAQQDALRLSRKYGITACAGVDPMTGNAEPLVLARDYVRLRRRLRWCERLVMASGACIVCALAIALWCAGVRG